MPPQKGSAGDDPGVVRYLEGRAVHFVQGGELFLHFFRAGNHGAEFHHVEPPFVETDPLLGEEDRAGGRHFDEDGDSQQKGRQDDQPDQGGKDVEDPLEGQPDVIHGDAGKSHAAEIVDAGGRAPDVFRLEEVADDGGRDAVKAAEIDDAADDVVEGADRQEDEGHVDDFAAEGVLKRVGQPGRRVFNFGQHFLLLAQIA